MPTGPQDRRAREVVEEFRQLLEGFSVPEHYVVAGPRDAWIVTAADIGKPGEVVLSLKTARTGHTGEMRYEIEPNPDGSYPSAQDIVGYMATRRGMDAQRAEWDPRYDG